MRVLITGATGFVGSRITNFLLNQNIEVYYLTTSKEKIIDKNNYKGFYWNPDLLEVDKNAIENVDYIINLSGKSISCRWNKKNKKEILESRIQSSKTLFKLLTENKNSVKKIISASAIGIYRNDFHKYQSENETVLNSGFLGEVCKKWEAENEKFNTLNIQTLIIRFGLILSKNDGALPEFTKMIKMYLGSLLGSGKQWYSWIHIDDLIQVIFYGISTDLNGIVNGVSPNPKKQKDFLITLSKTLNKKLMLPRVSTSILNLTLGEMHHLITDSQKISANKLLKAAFIFKYPTLREALKDLYKK